MSYIQGMSCTSNPTDGEKFNGFVDAWPRIFQDLRQEEVAIKPRRDEGLLWVELRHRKWRVIHKYLVDHPFVIDSELDRADQWRAVLAHCDTLFFEQDITNWLNAQAHIAENLAAGIRDLRPRKNGPCYDMFMEFVRNAKRKYHVTHRWLKAAQAQGTPLSWSVPPQMGDT